MNEDIAEQIGKARDAIERASGQRPEFVYFRDRVYTYHEFVAIAKEGIKEFIRREVIEPLLRNIYKDIYRPSRPYAGEAWRRNGKRHGAHRQ